MGSNIPQEQKLARRAAKMELHGQKADHFFRHVLHFLERVVASVTLIVLVIALVYEVYMLIINPARLADPNAFLHNILAIVVGLEFVRMLIDTTPANILEVLTVAITRYVILSHEDYWSNLVCIACIAGLFAIRRYLVRPGELKEEMVDTK